jgi:hypothetical protein
MLEGVRPEQANIIKQEMLGKGGEAAVARGVIDCSVSETKVLLMGTLKQYDAFLAKLQQQPFGLADLAGRPGQPGRPGPGGSNRPGGDASRRLGLPRHDRPYWRKNVDNGNFERHAGFFF